MFAMRRVRKVFSDGDHCFGISQLISEVGVTGWLAKRLTERKVLGLIQGPVKSAHSATNDSPPLLRFFSVTNCVAQAPSRGNRPRHYSHALA